MTSTQAGTVTVTRRDGVTVHTYTAPEAGWRTNSHVVELADEVVVVDAPLTVSSFDEVAEVVAALGKPVMAVYVTHAHPDHFATAGLFGAPVRALAATAAAIESSGAARTGGAYALSGLGAPPAPPAVGAIVPPGEAVVGGVRFVFLAVHEGETADQLVISLPDQGLLFAGDLVFSGVHAFVAERRFDGWLAALGLLPAAAVVLPGHGLPGDSSLVSSTREYLEQSRNMVGSASSGHELTAALTAAFPSHEGLAMQALQNYFLFPAVG